MEREKRKGVNIVRDFLCNKEYLDGTIKYEVGHIAKLEEELASRQNDIKNGIQRYSRKNEDIIFDIKMESFQKIDDLLCAKYSYGMNCEELEGIYLKGVDVVRDIGYERIGYVMSLVHISEPTRL